MVRDAQARSMPSWGPSTSHLQQVPRPGRLERAKQAALDLAREGGYDAVTMPRVAERSGISRANLYQHFVSKDHLIAAAFGDTIEDRIGAPTGRALRAPTAGERVLAYLDQAIDRSVAQPQLIDAYVPHVLVSPRVAPMSQNELDVNGVVIGTVALIDISDVDKLHLFLYGQGLIDGPATEGGATVALKSFRDDDASADSGRGVEEVRAPALDVAGARSE